MNGYGDVSEQLPHSQKLLFCYIRHNGQKWFRLSYTYGERNARSDDIVIASAARTATWRFHGTLQEYSDRIGRGCHRRGRLARRGGPALVSRI
jgi:hypothetical protein